MKNFILHSGNPKLSKNIFSYFSIVMKSTFFKLWTIRDHKLYVVGMLRNRFCLLHHRERFSKRDSSFWKHKRVLFGVMRRDSEYENLCFYHRRVLETFLKHFFRVSLWIYQNSFFRFHLRFRNLFRQSY